MVTLSDCQRTQHAWFKALAEATGGRSFSTHRMDWVWLPETSEMLCMFPTEVTMAGLEPALEEAKRRGAKAVGVWMNAAMRPGILPQNHFERGWQPWWMTRALDVESVAGTSEVPDSRVALTAIKAEQVWLATARIGDDWAGRSYAHLAPEQDGKHLAGIFDMVVAPQHRRSGIGTALLDRLAEAAFNAGAEHLLINATPDGQRLFGSSGFELIGKGQTWWFHPPAPEQPESEQPEPEQPEP